MRVTLILMLALWSQTPALLAQLPSLGPGSRVRITHDGVACSAGPCQTGQGTLIGRLTALGTDSAFVTPDEGSPTAVSLAAITRIDIPGADHLAPVEGAAGGLLGGVALGAVIWGFATGTAAAASAVPCDEQTLWCPDLSPDPLSTYMLKGAAGGAVAGLLVGFIASAAAQSSWRNVFMRRDSAWGSVTPVVDRASIGVRGQVTF